MGILDAPGAREMEIVECGEPMETLSPEEFKLDPRYFKMGYADLREIQLRDGVLERLRKAKQKLNEIPGCENWNFKIWDGFRTYKTQQILYFNYWNELLAQHPKWDNETLCAATTKFVSKASVDAKSPAPHNTGGAVDLTLVDEHGGEVDMGTEFDEFSERAATNYFATDKGLMGAEWYNRNRMTLKKVMEAVGFVNYAEEWWHFSYGDQMWAAAGGEECAIYGSVELG